MKSLADYSAPEMVLVSLQLEGIMLGSQDSPAGGYGESLLENLQ